MVDVLIERDRELARLQALLGEAATESGRLVLLSGDAGAGKTTLLSHFVATVGGRAEVRWGAVDNMTTPAPLGGAIDAFPDIAEMLDTTTTANRMRVYRHIRDMLAASPTLLVLEDVHWADEATLDLIRFLGRRLVTMCSLLVISHRAAAAQQLRGPLPVLLGDLAGALGVHRMVLPPLSVGGVQQLVEQSSVDTDAATLHRRTGGNPFFVTEVLAAVTDPLIDTVPESVRDAVLARAARLTDSARQALAAAAVLARSAPAPLIAAVADEPVEAVDECIAQGMLIGDGDGWMFRHELARLAVEQTLLPGVRTRLHGRALREVILLTPADHRTLAFHAAGCADYDALLEHAPQAAARSAQLGAHREATVGYRKLVQIPNLSTADRVRFYEALSYECYLTEEASEAIVARRRVLELSQLTGDTVTIGTAERWLSRLSWFLGRNADAHRYAGRAVTTLEPLGDSHELAMAQSNLAQLYMLTLDADSAVEWGTRALATARRIGDREVEMHALNNIGTALGSRDDRIEGRHRLAQSLDLALAEDAHEHVARAYTNLASIAVINRRFADGERHLRAGVDYCEERDLDSWGHYMGTWLALCLLERGQYDESDRTISQLLGRPTLLPVSRIPAAVIAALLAFRRGADGSVLLSEATELAVGADEAQRLVPVALARAEVAWLHGRPEIIEREVDLAWGAAIQQPNPWALGELCWWLRVAGAEPRELPTDFGELPVPFALMLQNRWLDAAERWRKIGCPLWVAHCLSRDPDLDSAREALVIVEQLGAVTVREALLAARFAAGLPVPRGPRPSSRSHPGSLTNRELEVLRLVAGGLSNGDVAGQLFLSEKTVEHHMSSVLRKLGQPTRARAVAAAVRDGIVTVG